MEHYDSHLFPSDEDAQDLKHLNGEERDLHDAIEEDSDEGSGDDDNDGCAEGSEPGRMVAA